MGHSGSEHDFRRVRFGVRGARAWLLPLVLLSLPLGAIAATESRVTLNGLPFTRFYAFDEIGDMSHGVWLSFDRHGRILAMQDGSVVALNDNEWLNLSPADPQPVRIQNIVRDLDGKLVYGAQGSCGFLETSADGRLRPISVLPATYPEWVLGSNFLDVVPRAEAVYFAGFTGIVCWQRATKQVRFVEIEGGVVGIFDLHGEVYVSTHARGMMRLDPDTLTLGDTDKERFGNTVVDHAARLGDGRVVVSSTGRSLFVYDGVKLRPLPGPLSGRLEGRIDALIAISDKLVAAAVTGKGLYLVSGDGEIDTALTAPEYRRINALAANEPAVLWAGTENGVAKILHRAGITWFGQALGLTVNWPQVVPWQRSVAIASNGRIYEPVAGSPGEPVHFRLREGQPYNGSWAIASLGDWLLVGNGDGVFGCQPGQRFAAVLPGVEATRLAISKSGICYAIGVKEIAALVYEDGHWRECAPRVPGLGYPAIVHAAADSVWLEIGPNRAVRLALRQGRIVTRVFDQAPGTTPSWVNVSVIGDIVTLIGLDNGPTFFDERTEALCTHPPVEAVLRAAPYPAARIQRDDTGRYWISHAHGVCTLTEHDGRYEADTFTYRTLTEHTPLIRALPGSDVWISRGNSLYHVNPPEAVCDRNGFAPVLVSARDLHTNRELLETGDAARALQRPLAYEHNGLALRFFAGSYALKRMPGYQYRINGSAWSSLEAASVLRLPDLHEGAYQLDVRLFDDAGPLAAGTSFHFAIEPPWYRTWAAYAVYGLLALAAVLATVRLALYRARARNAFLEKTVADRTEELKATMAKLEQETRVAATLAERNRLAGEIHDSLEQGFSGLMLHLETTAGLANCPPPVEGALKVARNMVAFSRNEVRQAVWDLHSPRLDSGGLEAALKNLIAEVGPDSTRASITVRGTSHPLGSTIEHHLVRIAQEAIANAVKHAEPNHIDIRLTFSESQLELSVHDDGRGFDPHAVLASPMGHFGLRSLRGRAAKIGGTIEIVSEPRRGTRVVVRLPLPVPNLSSNHAL